MDKQTVRQLLLELSEFEKTKLFGIFNEHFKMLYDTTVDSVLNVELKGAETLYTREAWIGEARASLLILRWFADLKELLEDQLRALEQHSDQD